MKIHRSSPGIGFLDSRYVNVTGDTITGTLTVPTIIGGTSTTADLTLQTTSGVGATGADMHFLVGNNGATEAMTILNSGFVGIGTTGPGTTLDVVGYIRTQDGIVGRSSTGKLSLFGDYEAGVAVTIQDNGNVGIGTTAPTNLLSLGNGAARIIWAERSSVANTAGNTLTITASGATSGATDKAGGALILQGGLSTGSAESGVTIQGCVAGATGTADRTQTTAIQVLGNKLGFYGVTPITRAVLATGAGATVDNVITALQNLGLVSQT